MVESINQNVANKVLTFQRNELTEHIIYSALSKRAKGVNSQLLKKMSEDELRHYGEWRNYTGRDVAPNRLMLLKYILISRLFGLTFAVKLMEKGEGEAEEVYEKISSVFPKAMEIRRDEIEHEKILIGMIDEEMVNYVGSLVLGLNDALVELTGALVGLAFTLQNSRLVGVSGLITGIAASISMSASEYLSKKSEKSEKSPSKASLYTGLTYLATVLILSTPYLLLSDYRIAVAIMFPSISLIVLIFTFFISVTKDVSFRKMFLEMILISLGVAAVSFVIGWVARILFGIEV
ncbi:MAG: VIT1/CCC1 family protein [Crenarchaeota archaeon]|nr:VIT1/CCC1 family protein [Thermoproteota archaeon]